MYSKQTQVGGRKNSVILQKLTPDTAYSITVAAVYRTGEPKDISGQGKTSMCFFFFKNLPKVFVWYPFTIQQTFISRIDNQSLSALLVYLIISRAIRRGAKPPGPEPNHDHTECALGASWRKSKGVQGCIYSCSWWTWSRGRTKKIARC